MSPITETFPCDFHQQPAPGAANSRRASLLLLLYCPLPARQSHCGVPCTEANGTHQPPPHPAPLPSGCGGPSAFTHTPYSSLSTQHPLGLAKDFKV